MKGMGTIREGEKVTRRIWMLMSSLWLTDVQHLLRIPLKCLRAGLPRGEEKGARMTFRVKHSPRGAKVPTLRFAIS